MKTTINIPQDLVTIDTFGLLPKSSTGRWRKWRASVSSEDAEKPSQTTDASRDTTGRTAVTEPVAPEDVDWLPKDVVFGLLSNERRRHVLNCLDGGTKATSLSDLAKFIASIENDKPVDAVSSNIRKRVYVSLYQCHLPKMDDANAIEYNQSKGTVEHRPEADQLFAYLSVDSVGTPRTEL